MLSWVNENKLYLLEYEAPETHHIESRDGITHFKSTRTTVVIGVIGTGYSVVQ